MTATEESSYKIKCQSDITASYVVYAFANIITML